MADHEMNDLSWTKLILIVGAFQVLFAPILWKGYIPLSASTVIKLRVVSVLLFAPTYLFLTRALRTTSDEDWMVAILSAIFAGIQGVVLAVLHEWKKSNKRTI